MQNTDTLNILEIGLPIYLENDINALIEGKKNNSSLLDCLYCEVRGSLNSAYWDNEISEEQYNYLSDKYL